MNSMYAVIGMSPGNSYFKQEVVTKLLEKALLEYPKVGIFIADVPAIATYKALGYPENRARRDKAIPQGNALKNRVINTISLKNIDSTKVRIFDWSEEKIDGNTAYKEQFKYIAELYETNKDFRKEVQNTTREVLIDHSLRKVEIGEKEIETGTHYLLSEIAFMLFLPGYINEETVGYIYHKPWPVFEKLIAGEYDRPKENVQFILFPDFTEFTELS